MHSKQIKKTFLLALIIVIAVSVVALPVSAAVDPDLPQETAPGQTNAPPDTPDTPGETPGGDSGDTTTNLPTLYDVCVQFWQFWLGDNFNDPSTVQLLSALLAIGIVYFVLILPFLKLCKGGRKS